MHDTIQVLWCIVVLCMLAGVLFVVCSVTVWAVLTSGAGGRFRADVNAFMKRHGIRGISLKIFMAALILDPGFQAVYFYRFSALFVSAGFLIPAMICQAVGRMLSGADISCHANIGGGLEVFHASGLCVGRNVKIGENTWLFQNVTIGSSGRGCPEIGNGVKIFAGAVVAGGIKVGDSAIIGANAVVLSDVPEGYMVESPASLMRDQQEMADGKRAIDSDGSRCSKYCS